MIKWSKETGTGTIPLTASQVLFQCHPSFSSTLSSIPRSNQDPPGTDFVSPWSPPTCNTPSVYSCLSWPWPFEKYWSDTLKVVPDLGLSDAFSWLSGWWNPGQNTTEVGWLLRVSGQTGPGSACSVTGNTAARPSPHPRGEETTSTCWEEMYQRLHAHNNSQHRNQDIF